MTQEEKQLLLLDICGKLPHGVKIWYKYFIPNTFVPFATSIRLAEEKIALSRFLHKEGDWYPIEEAGEILIKPYLRPMSSMTEEERFEWADLFNTELEKLNNIDDEEKAEDLAPNYFAASHSTSIDWLNKHHFDYRGLIDLGLAIEAPKDMYKTK